MSIPDLLHVLRNHDADAPALVLLDGLKEEFRWTHGQLLQHSTGFRRALASAGVVRGSAVCVVADNCPQFIALFLACVDLGASFAPLHPDFGGAALTQVLRELQPGLVIVDDEVQGEQLRAILREARRVWRLRLRRMPWLRPVLHGSASELAGVARVATLSDDEQAVLVLHSSGSTGTPKVIEYNRWRLNLFLHWQRRLFTAFPDVPLAATPSARVNALPLAHFGGLSFVLQALLDGRAVYLPRTIAAHDYLQLAVRAQCQLLMLVPALYDALLADAVELPLPSALRYCLTMGEAAPPQLLERVARRLGARLYSAYGMSEGLSGLSHHGDDTPPDSCGRVLFGEAKLVDAASSPAVSSDCTEGELWVRNETTFSCYRDPALNAAQFSEGWYRTGDRFRRDVCGHHYFLGRVDAMCVINGRNVYPADVEAVFLRHPDVSDCMAAVLVLDNGRRRLGVVVCLRADSHANAASLIDWFLEHGALHATPAWLVLGESIPRNAAGKRDRLAVAELLHADYERCQRKVS